MKKLVLFKLISFLLLIPPYALSQDLDSFLLENLSYEEVEALEDEISKKRISENLKPLVNESTKKIELNDASLLEDNKNEIKKYGYNFFTSIPTSVTAVGDLPLPGDYEISLIDQFTVILSGSRQDIFDLNVQLDGTILFPELGSISVAGETFDEVKKKLTNLINQSYIGVNLDLSIKSLAAKKITIVGAVKTPGTYLVNPFSTISSALAYSGGISEIGTLRNIKLIRSNNQVFYFDLYKLLINGDKKQDINIQAGDVIVIDPAQQFIELDGEIKRPAIYEIKEDETLKDLINYGAGFTNIANETSITLRILDIESSSMKLVNSNDLNSSLENVISVQVNPYNSRNVSSINVFGAVKEPGHYRSLNNESLEDFIKRIEFIDVYPWLAVLEQYDDKALERQSILFSLRDPSTYKSIKMMPNSKLYFFNLFEIESFKKYSLEEIDSSQIEINESTDGTYNSIGETKNISLNHAANLNQNSKSLINDYVLRINHKEILYELPVFGEFKLESIINFIGFDMSDIQNTVTYISPLEDLIFEDNYKNIIRDASKFNAVTFKSSKNDLINVTISGAVEYPGTYTLKSNATLEDLYSFVGNFKEQAFKSGVILTRESIRQRQIEALETSKEQMEKLLVSQARDNPALLGNISMISNLSDSIDTRNLGRLSGDFSPTSKSINKIILRDGDNIIVPVIPHTISILGEVNNQVTFEYVDKINVNSAIDMAGGFNEYANKRKVYIIKSNGLTVKASSFIIGNPKLDVGDTIVVPRKVMSENPIIKAMQPVTQIISNLAFSAAALESLSNSSN